MPAKEYVVEKTFVMIKPDGVAKNIIGDIIKRFETAGLKVRELRLLKLTEAQARELYSVHADKSFYESLVSFILSGPVVTMVLEGESAVSTVRGIMGATNPMEADPKTIRADYAEEIEKNIVHGSDSQASYERESVIFFPAAI